MNHRMGLSILASLALLALGGSAGGQAQQTEMSFFVTSAGSGKGGDLLVKSLGIQVVSQPGNLSRTLKKMADYGLVEMKSGDGGRKLRPVVKAEEFRILAAA